MTVWVIVVAAGGGARFGGLKQYESLVDRRVVDWGIDAARSVASGVVLAVVAERVHEGEDTVDAVVAGGRTRSQSVRAALAAVPEDADVIVVHDAARPLAPPRLFRSVVAALGDGIDGAVPALAVTDTMKRVRDGMVVDTPARADLVAVQTPQAFRAAALRRAHASGGEATDDAALVEAAGGRVVVVAGDPANLKLTSAEDLARARAAVLGPERPDRAGSAGPERPDRAGSAGPERPDRAGSAGPERPDRAGSTGPPAVTVRTGLGFDVHPFSDDPGRRLVLGGVALERAPGLIGHSDADVVAHAVADALLGAAGLGDLGSHFPDDDPAWSGADSLVLLAGVMELLAAAGWAVANVDCSIVAEAPALAPHLTTMQERLSAVVGAAVSVKAKRAESLGALGRGEGVACWAVALVERR